MKRFYIKCPLEAGLAAKNHGFTFVDWLNRPIFLKNDINQNSFCWIYCADHDEPFPGGGLYIADESLPMMEPMVGDLIGLHHGILMEERYYRIEDKSELKEAVDAFKIGRCRIIKRVGHSFPKIEVDDE